MLLEKLILLERAKSIKVSGPIGSRLGQPGFTVRDIQKLERDIEDALEPLGLKRAQEYIFKNGAIRFTNAADITPKVKQALKKFGVK